VPFVLKMATFNISKGKKTMIPLLIHSRMKKSFTKKINPSSLHMSNEGEKKTLTSTPSPSTVKKI
jgi:hypothetical protein